VHSLVQGALNEATAWEIFVRNFEDNTKLDRHERTVNLGKWAKLPYDGIRWSHLVNTATLRFCTRMWLLAHVDCAQPLKENLVPLKLTGIYFFPGRYKTVVT